MSPAPFVKIILRLFGTLTGLVGLGLLCIMPLVLFRSVSSRMVIFTVFGMALGAYFLYVAYLAWFRFSPVAVRHISGTVGYAALAVIGRLLDPKPNSAEVWPALAFVGSFFAIYLIYRFVSNRLNGLLFPAVTPPPAGSEPASGSV